MWAYGSNAEITESTEKLKYVEGAEPAYSQDQANGSRLSLMTWGFCMLPKSVSGPVTAQSAK